MEIPSEEKKYSMVGNLGSGFFGEVIEVEYYSSKVLYAAKKYNIRTEDEQALNYEQRCQGLQYLQHENLVCLIGFHNVQIQYVVMEKLKMDLKYLQDNIPEVSLTVKLSILSDVANGLTYLHSSDIIHGDLIPTNVLLTSCFTAKISDVWNIRITGIKPRDFAEKLCSQSSSSLAYLPIEDFKKSSEYKTSMDVFAFGKLVLHVLIQVFSSVHNFVEVHSSEKCVANLHTLFHNNYPDIVTMVTNSIQEDPEKRPTMSENFFAVQDVLKKVEDRQGGRGSGVASLMMTLEMVSKERKIQELENEVQSLRERISQLDQTDTLDSFVHSEGSHFQNAVDIDESKDHNTQRNIKNEVPRWNLTWKEQEDMPFDMSRNIQIVKIGRIVYIGGGDAERKNIENEYRVMSLNLSTNCWVDYEYQVKWFAMVTINDQLALVGGRNKDRKDENRVGVLEGRRWNFSKYQPMPTCRSHCSAVVYKTWMVVAGGTTIDLETLSTVEILNLQNNQWQESKEAKFQFYSMKSVVLGDTWYLMGGYHGHTVSYDVLEVSLEHLVSGDGVNVWMNICQVPCFHATPVLLNGNLLAIGGRTSAYKSEDTIYAYNKARNTWNLVAKLMDTINNCAGLVISDTINIFGGYNGRNRQSSVYSAAIPEYLH